VPVTLFSGSGGVGPSNFIEIDQTIAEVSAVGSFLYPIIKDLLRWKRTKKGATATRVKIDGGGANPTFLDFNDKEIAKRELKPAASNGRDRTLECRP
jgi:hypothetical protein